jgi:hypothetical protein
MVCVFARWGCVCGETPHLASANSRRSLSARAVRFHLEYSSLCLQPTFCSMRAECPRQTWCTCAATSGTFRCVGSSSVTESRLRHSIVAYANIGTTGIPGNGLHREVGSNQQQSLSRHFRLDPQCKCRRTRGPRFAIEYSFFSLVAALLQLLLSGRPSTCASAATFGFRIKDTAVRL